MLMGPGKEAGGENMGVGLVRTEYACVKFSKSKKVNPHCVSACLSSFSSQLCTLLHQKKKNSSNPSYKKIRSEAHKSFLFLNKIAANNN